MASGFPIESRFLAHDAPRQNAADSAAGRVAEACDALDTTWSRMGSQHRLAHHVMKTVDPQRPNVINATSTIHGKARCACVVTLPSSCAIAAQSETTVWTASEKCIDIRSSTTGAVLESIKQLKPNAVPTAMAFLHQHRTNSHFGSPGRRTDEFPPALLNGNFVVVGFGDGTLRAVVASPSEACDRNKKFYGTNESFIALELPKTHAGAVTDIQVAPSLDPSLKRGFVSLDGTGGAEQLFCVASADSFVTVWSGLQLGSDAVAQYAAEMKRVTSMRERKHLVPQTSQENDGATAHLTPFFVKSAVHTDAAGAGITYRARALGVSLRPVARLKGNVAGIRCLSWTAVAIASELPSDFCWGALSRTNAVNSLLSSRRDPTSEAPDPKAATAWASQSELSHEAVTDDAAPDRDKSYRRVDLLLTGDDEGRLALWDLQQEVRGAADTREQTKRDSIAATSRYTGSVAGKSCRSAAPSKSSPSRSGSVMERPAFKPSSKSTSTRSASFLTQAKFGTFHSVKPRTSDLVLEFGCGALMGLAADVAPVLTLEGAGMQGVSLGDGSATAEDLFAAVLAHLRLFCAFSEAHNVVLASQIVRTGSRATKRVIAGHVFNPIPGRFTFTSCEAVFAQLVLPRLNVATTCLVHDSVGRLLHVSASCGSTDVWDMSTLSVVCGTAAPDAPDVLSPVAAEVAREELHEAFRRHPACGEWHTPYVHGSVSVGTYSWQMPTAFTRDEDNSLQSHLLAGCPVEVDGYALDDLQLASRKVAEMKRTANASKEQLVDHMIHAQSFVAEHERLQDVGNRVPVDLAWRRSVSWAMMRWIATARTLRLARAAEDFNEAAGGWNSERHALLDLNASKLATLVRQRNVTLARAATALGAAAVAKTIRRAWQAWIDALDATKRHRQLRPLSCAVDSKTLAGRTFWNWLERTLHNARIRDASSPLGLDWETANGVACQARLSELARADDAAIERTDGSVAHASSVVTDVFDPLHRQSMLALEVAGSAYALVYEHIVRRVKQTMLVTDFADAEVESRPTLLDGVLSVVHASEALVSALRPAMSDAINRMEATLIEKKAAADAAAEEVSTARAEAHPGSFPDASASIAEIESARQGFADDIATKRGAVEACEALLRETSLDVENARTALSKVTELATALQREVARRAAADPGIAESEELVQLDEGALNSRQARSKFQVDEASALANQTTERLAVAQQELARSKEAVEAAERYLVAHDEEFADKYRELVEGQARMEASHASLKSKEATLATATAAVAEVETALAEARKQACCVGTPSTDEGRAAAVAAARRLVVVCDAFEAAVDDAAERAEQPDAVMIQHLHGDALCTLLDNAFAVCSAVCATR